VGHTFEIILIKYSVIRDISKFQVISLYLLNDRLKVFECHLFQWQTSQVHVSLQEHLVQLLGLIRKGGIDISFISKLEHLNLTDNRTHVCIVPLVHRGVEVALIAVDGYRLEVAL
jgi:hypothetical protein